MHLKVNLAFKGGDPWGKMWFIGFGGKQHTLGDVLLTNTCLCDLSPMFVCMLESNFASLGYSLSLSLSLLWYVGDELRMTVLL